MRVVYYAVVIPINDLFWPSIPPPVIYIYFCPLLEVSPRVVHSSGSGILRTGCILRSIPPPVITFLPSEKLSHRVIYSRGGGILPRSRTVIFSEAPVYYASHLRSSVAHPIRNVTLRKMKAQLHELLCHGLRTAGGMCRKILERTNGWMKFQRCNGWCKVIPHLSSLPPKAENMLVSQKVMLFVPPSFVGSMCYNQPRIFFNRNASFLQRTADYPRFGFPISHNALLFMPGNTAMSVTMMTLVIKYEYTNDT